MNLNKIIIVGRVTSNPELKALPSGQSVVNFGMATNRYWTDKEGKKQESAEFHNIVAFGRTAEVLEQYVGKGGLLLVVGRNVTRNWEDKDSGKKMYRTEIHVEEFQLAPKALSGDSEGGTERARAKKKADDEFENFGKDDGKVEAEEGINPEDIPF